MAMQNTGSLNDLKQNKAELFAYWTIGWAIRDADQLPKCLKTYISLFLSNWFSRFSRKPTNIKFNACEEK